jgi:hypothetical protein
MAGLDALAPQRPRYACLIRSSASSVPLGPDSVMVPFSKT